MKFYCIADEDTVRGLRLAGVEGQAVATAQEAGAALATAAADSEIGILILTQDVATSIRALVDTHRLERAQPLLVEIPGPTGPHSGRKSLRQIAQAAVGISVGEDDAG